jgi:hypothetical protein
MLWASTIPSGYPARLQADYVPKGFDVAWGPIKGHEFGLKLSPDDTQAVIAFLKTLWKSLFHNPLPDERALDDGRVEFRSIDPQ